MSSISKYYTSSLDFHRQHVFANVVMLQNNNLSYLTCNDNGCLSQCLAQLSFSMSLRTFLIVFASIEFKSHERSRSPFPSYLLCFFISFMCQGTLYLSAIFFFPTSFCFFLQCHIFIKLELTVFALSAFMAVWWMYFLCVGLIIYI